MRMWLEWDSDVAYVIAHSILGPKLVKMPQTVQD